MKAFPPLSYGFDRNSILKSLMWGQVVKKNNAHGFPTGNSEESVLSGIMDCAMHEAALHGKEFHDDFQGKLLTILERHPTISNDAVPVSYGRRILHISGRDLQRFGEWDEE